MQTKFNLTNLINLTEKISEPLKQTSRVKYICFDVSENLIAVGANSGTVYLFKRPDATLQELIPSKLGAINQLEISNDEKYVAFSNVRGSVAIAQIRSAVLTTRLDNGSYVTSFYWSKENQLVCGDNRGSVSIISIETLTGKTKLQLNKILLLESSIVQICGHDELLVISTYSKSVLCNISREIFKTIGNRPRDGEYGACILTIENNFHTNTQIFCARPGLRLWQVSLEGNVLHTHQFKAALSVPPRKILDCNFEKTEFIQNVKDNNCDSPSNTFHFSKLFVFMDRFIFSYSDSKLYIINPSETQIILWSNTFSNIHSAHVINNEIYIFTNTGELYNTKCSQLDNYVLDLFVAESYVSCGQLIIQHLNYFKDLLKTRKDLFCLYKLRNSLEKMNQNEMVEALKGFFDEIFTKSTQWTLQNGTLVMKCREIIPIENSEHLPKIIEKRDKPEVFMSESQSLEFSEDEKHIRNLYLIYKSSRISNVNFADRYALIFRNMDIKKIIKIICRLEELMVTNDHDGPIDARKNSLCVFFDYFQQNPAIVYELDDEDRNFIKNGFITLNEDMNGTLKCIHCNHPLGLLSSKCQYAEVGQQLLKFYWSRNHPKEILEISSNVPFLLQYVATLYINERNMERAVPFVFNLGKEDLLKKAADMFDVSNWRKLFDLALLFVLESKMICLLCNSECLIDLEVHANIFNFGLDQIFTTASKHINGGLILDILAEHYVDRFPKGALPKEFYLNCLLSR